MELAISGPDETPTQVWCDTCNQITDQVIYTHPEIFPEMECSECGTITAPEGYYEDFDLDQLPSTLTNSNHSYTTGKETS